MPEGHAVDIALVSTSFSPPLYFYASDICSLAMARCRFLDAPHMYEEMSVKVTKTRRGLKVGFKSNPLDLLPLADDVGTSASHSNAPHLPLTPEDMPDVPGYNEFTFDDSAPTRRKGKVCTRRLSLVDETNSQ